MNSPAQVRLWRSAMQRKVRTVFSTLAGAEFRWKKYSTEAREAATEAVNLLLKEKDQFSQLAVGALPSPKELLIYVALKLSSHRAQQCERLQGACAQLEGAVQDMRQAADQLHDAMQGFGNVQLGVEYKPTAPPAGSGSPVSPMAQAPTTSGPPIMYSGPIYNVLSLKTLVALADEFVKMFEEELQVKVVISAELLAQLDVPPPVEATMSDANIKSTLEVYLTALLVEPLINPTRLEEIQVVLENEFKTN